MEEQPLDPPVVQFVVVLCLRTKYKIGHRYKSISNSHFRFSGSPSFVYKYIHICVGWSCCFLLSSLPYFLL